MVIINLSKKNHSISIKSATKTNITLKKNASKNITVKHSGKQGVKGDRGDIGFGIPTGGAHGQVLQKISDQDYDFTWTTPDLIDKTYSQDFTVSNDILIRHMLSKYPAVSVIDSAGDEVEGDVVYIDDNSIRLLFAAPFSGKVICN